eukprot:gene13969-14086_t
MIFGAPFAAEAADLPSYKSPAPPILTQGAPSYDWSGFYVGAISGLRGSTANTLMQNGTGALGAAPGNGSGATNAYSSTTFQNYAAESAPYVAYTNTTRIPVVGMTYSGADSNTSVNNPGFTTQATAPAQTTSRNLTGGAGLETGYNFKLSDHFVIGVAGDAMSFSGGTNTSWNSYGSYSNTNSANSNVSSGNYSNGTIGGPVPSVSSSSIVVNSGSSHLSGSTAVKQNWVSTARLSAGFTQDRVMVFGTAGLAFGQATLTHGQSYSDSNNASCIVSGGANNVGGYAGASCTGAPPTTVGTGSNVTTVTNAYNWTGSKTKMMAGFAAGGGVAYAMTDHIILKFDALYYNLGTIKLTANGTGTTTSTTNGVSSTTTSSGNYSVSKMIDGAIGRMSVAYKF